MTDVTPANDTEMAAASELLGRQTAVQRTWGHGTPVFMVMMATVARQVGRKYGLSGDLLMEIILLK